MSNESCEVSSTSGGLHRISMFILYVLYVRDSYQQEEVHPSISFEQEEVFNGSHNALTLSKYLKYFMTKNILRLTGNRGSRCAQQRESRAGAETDRE